MLYEVITPLLDLVVHGRDQRLHPAFGLAPGDGEDLPEALREAREADGSLRFRAGNIAVHALSVDFVEAVTSEGFELPWHVATRPDSDHEDPLV